MQRGAPRFLIVAGPDQPEHVQIPGALRMALARRGDDVEMAPSHHHGMADMVIRERSLRSGGSEVGPGIVILLEPGSAHWAREFHRAIGTYAPSAAIWSYDARCSPQLAAFIPRPDADVETPGSDEPAPSLRLAGQDDEDAEWTESRICEPRLERAGAAPDEPTPLRAPPDDARGSDPMVEEEPLVSDAELSMLLGGGWDGPRREPSAGAEG